MAKLTKRSIAALEVTDKDYSFGIANCPASVSAFSRPVANSLHCSTG